MPSALTVPFIKGSTRSLNAEMNPRVSLGMEFFAGFGPETMRRAHPTRDPERFLLAVEMTFAVPCHFEGAKRRKSFLWLGRSEERRVGKEGRSRRPPCAVTERERAR